MTRGFSSPRNLPPLRSIAALPLPPPGMLGIQRLQIQRIRAPCRCARISSAISGIWVNSARSGSRAAKPRAPMGSASRAQHMPSQPTSAGDRRPPTVITASFRYLRCSSIPIRYRAAGSFFFWTFSIIWSCTCAEGMVTFTAEVYLPCILHCKHKNSSRIHIDQSPWISPLL